MTTDSLFLGGGGADYAEPQRLLLRLANRHGLVAGATGTGKTVTLQGLAEGFSEAGVPVVLADVKGDLTGLAQPGDPSAKLHEALVARAERIGFDDFGYAAPPVALWDVFGEAGHPLRTTVSEIGPMLLARLLELNEVQEGVLSVAFRLADEEGLLLLDLKDLRALLAETSARASELSARFGQVAPASVAAIQRRLLMLEDQGADLFLGEPALALEDLIATRGGRGVVNVIAAARLMRAPRLYATVLLWLLSELFESLPEVGDPEKPVVAFFFDEAHLLFDRAPPALIDQVEQVARLIRSKGVAVFFVTQSPADVPDVVLGQLGARIQHALRAYTPRERKALRAAAESFRPNPAFDAEAALPELGTGEALVSTLDAKGRPTPVERVLIRPPGSRLGPADPDVLDEIRRDSPLGPRYERTVDRESAYEILAARAEAAAAREAETEAQSRPEPAPRAPARRSDSAIEAGLKSALRSVGTTLGRELVRGILGSLRRR